MEEKREALLNPQEDKYVAIEDGDELHSLEENEVHDTIIIHWGAVATLALSVILFCMTLYVAFVCGQIYELNKLPSTSDLIVDVIRDFCTEESILQYDDCEGGYGDEAYMCYNYTFKEMTITFMSNDENQYLNK